MRSLLVFKTIKKMLTTKRRMKFSLQITNVSDAASDNNIPSDVKEGHFVVRTFDNGEMKRFILKLGYLSHPDFMNLLELAAEEFGFQQEGVLAVPCGPGELQKILEKMKFI